MIATPNKMWLDGILSETVGIYCLSCPPVTVAGKNIEEIIRPHNPVVLTRWNGTYESKILTSRLFFDGIDKTEAISVLSKANRIRWSNDPTYTHDVLKVETFSFEYYLGSIAVFEFTVIVQPLKFIENEQYISQLSFNLVNDGTAEMRPMFGLIGTGIVSITVGDWTSTIEDIVGSLTIDSLQEQVYDSEGNAWHKLSNYRLPVIGIGETVAISTTATTLYTQPQKRWR